VPGGGAWTRSGGGAWTGSDNDAWTRSDSGGRAAIGEIGSPSVSLGDGSHQSDQSSASSRPLPFPAGWDGASSVRSIQWSAGGRLGGGGAAGWSEAGTAVAAAMTAGTTLAGGSTSSA
jgi:hypothetical protein